MFFIKKGNHDMFLGKKGNLDIKPFSFKHVDDVICCRCCAYYQCYKCHSYRKSLTRFHTRDYTLNGNVQQDTPR